MSELTKQALKVENNMSFPNNNAGLITPSALRTFNEDMIDSTVNQAVYTADSASFDQRIDAISGSVLPNTGSLLTTASFDNNTRNLTFTKGDSSTFAVNIPDATGSILPSGVVSGSSQIILQDTTGLLSGSRIDGAVTSSLTSISASHAETADVVGLFNNAIADGVLDQFLSTDGSGNLSFDWVKTLHQNIHNATTSSIVRGTPLYVSGSTGDNANVYLADASNSNRRPAVLIAYDATLAPGATGTGIISGEIQGVDTNLYPAGTIVYLGVGGGWTATRPTGSDNLVQALGVITRQSNNGRGVVFNQIGNNLPNIQEGYAWVGDSTGVPVAVSTGSFGGGGASFPYVGDAEITGSLIVSSSGQSVTLYAANLGQNSGVVVNGRLDVNGQFSATSFFTSQIGVNSIQSNATPQIFFDNSIVLRPFYGPVKLEVTGSTILSGSLTASLQEGYTWVGDSTGVSKPFPTSSFGGGGSGNGFPFSGSAVITGSLSVSETVETQIFLTPQVLTGPLTVPSGFNGMLTGPVSNSGIITIASGSTLVII